MNLKHRDKLLAEIAEQLKELEGNRIYAIEVILIGPSGRWAFGLAEVLGVLANDLYWDERGNWSDACQADVRDM